MRLVLALALVCLVAGQPYIRAKVSTALADRLKDTAVEVVMQTVQSQHLSDVSGSENGVVDVDYSLTNIVIGSVSLQNTQLEFHTPAVAQFSVPDVEASMTFNWNYREHAWPHLGDDGTGSVTFKATIDVAVNFIASNGALSLTPNSVTVAINGMDLSTSGGASWLYDFLGNIIMSQVKNQAETSIATALVGALGGQAAQTVKSIPLLEPITSSAALDLRLVANPVFNAKYLTTAHMGLVTSLAGVPPKLAAQYAVPSLEDVDNGRMLQVVMSEAVFDSAGALYMEQGVFNQVITKLPDGAPFQLDVDSFADAVPPLGDAYPDNHPLQANVKAVSPPNFNISATGVHVVFPLELSVAVVTSAGPKPAFTLGVTVDFDGSIRLDGNKVSGDVSVLKAALSLKDSPVGNFSVTALEQLLTFVINHAVVPQVSATLRAGYALPIPSELMLVNPTLSTGPGYVLVSADTNFSADALAALIHGKM